jgi:2-C-methyl-D-erythritol 4-phosphate cytidylyltransferase
MSFFSVIFPAAGLSTRFGQNKLMANLKGQPVLVHVLNVFLPREDVYEVVIATRDRKTLEQAIQQLHHADEMLNSRKLRWCQGGPSRAHTVWEAARVTRSEWIAVHDAARPLVSQDLIDRTFRAALTYGAAAPAMPVNLTIKQAQGPLPAPVIRTVSRETLWAMQTPQCMRRSDLLQAYEKCPVPLDQVTDDLQILELAGQQVHLVPGEDRNIKITTPMDLEVADRWLDRSSSSGLSDFPGMESSVKRP